MKLSFALGAALAAALALPAAAQNGGQTDNSSRFIKPTNRRNRNTMPHRLGQTTTQTNARGATTNIRTEGLEKDNSDIGAYNRVQPSHGVAKDNGSILGPGNGSHTPRPFTMNRRLGQPAHLITDTPTSLQGYRVAGIVRTNTVRTHSHRRATSHRRTHRARHHRK